MPVRHWLDAMSCVQSLPEVTSEEETENDLPDEKAVTPSKPSRKSSGSLIPQSKNINKKRRDSGSLTKFVEEVELRLSEAEKTSKPPSQTTKRATGTPDKKATAAGNGTKIGKANPSPEKRSPLANTTNQVNVDGDTLSRKPSCTTGR
jgi:hypothetical protein